MSWYRKAADGGTEFGFEYDADFIASLKRNIPASHRRWDPNTKRWWVHQFFVVIAVRLIKARFGQELSGDNGSEQKQSGSTNGSYKSSNHSLFSSLHLLPTAPLGVVEAAYRAMAKACHPDVARGEQKADANRRMAEINAAIDLIRELAKNNRA